MDFIRISTRHTKKDTVEVYPKFIVGKSNDLMIRGGDFYAIWLEDKGVWSTDEQDVINTIDHELTKYAKDYKEKFGVSVSVGYMWDSNSGVIDAWHKYCQRQQRDNFKPLDENLIFSNQELKKEDYSTKKLNYSLDEGPCDAYEELMNVLYYPEEKRKIEWAIGAIITGKSKTIQKFIVLYGGQGTGKSTILNIIQQLFEGYYNTFDSKALGSASDVFALESFKNNPLVGIQHDGDLSKIEDNTRLNSLVSHELMTVNEKHKALYSTKFITFLLMGTNKPVKITDAKSGLLRRLIDVKPTGKRLPLSTYNRLYNKISFELGHIAYKCKTIFEEDPDYYDNYVATDMMGESNDFFNFMSDSYFIFKKEDKTTLKEAWEMYKTYVEQAKVQYPFSMRVVKSELKPYFDHYEENYQDSDTNQHIRNLYTGFRYQIFESKNKKVEDKKIVEDTDKDIKNLIFENDMPSALDEYCKDCPAQYATAAEVPGKKWDDVTTTLKDLKTKQLHYVKPPLNLIVIDFDLKGTDGKKNFKKNLEAAKQWPETYAELSKSGMGIHLHYIYDGDPTLLSRIYDDDVEIKVFTGNASLRRKLTKCNGIGISHISTGLPLKGNTRMEDIEIIKSEKRLRTMIKKNLNKEFHGATKPSVDFIYKLLEDAYTSGLKYDVSDMYNVILAFAANSTNQADYCLSLIPKMHFKSDDHSQSIDDNNTPIIIFDIEVFINVIFINWKPLGKGAPISRVINPKPSDIENLLKYRLVGFNNRRYDNHILYAILIGKTIPEVYQLSKNIIDDNKKALFGEAYNLSYTDIYDYASKKQSLKKWEIELGLHHMELGLPWDKPVAEELWPRVSAYCDNDVIATEAVWEATQSDFKARQILAEIAGMSVNDTTNALTTRFIFGSEKNPELVCPDLSKEFDGYRFVKTYNENTNKWTKENLYRGIDLGLGGYVYAEPGMYKNVALLDVESLHPNSAINLNAFGIYTDKFKQIVDTRVLIKHNKYIEARNLFDGKLEKYLKNEADAKELSNALKVAINSVYGLSSAKFANPFKHPNNENNIVALRGALFMKTLQDELTSLGYKVIHVKTDSIKIPDATKDVINFCMGFAKKYGYTFEHQATYDRICLVNDAVYIAKYMPVSKCINLYGYSPKDNSDNDGQWTATGAQFQVPYVFKKCFSKEPIIFEDLCETKEVKTVMYLDFNENLSVDENDRRFLGRVGWLCPVKPGYGGAIVVRESLKKDNSIGYDAVVGTKGYRWMDAEKVKGTMEDAIDQNYYISLVNDAIETINIYGDYYSFVADDQ
jgi:hypothetical protein